MVPTGEGAQGARKNENDNKVSNGAMVDRIEKNKRRCRKDIHASIEGLSCLKSELLNNYDYQGSNSQV